MQVGMLLELAAAGEAPDFVVGVSAGALNGAFFALAPSIGRLHRLLERELPYREFGAPHQLAVHTHSD